MLEYQTALLSNNLINKIGDYSTRGSTMQMSRLQVTWPFQALADETRFRVVRLILSFGAPLTAGQLANSLGMAANHLSRHLHILEAAGLTTIERRGRSHFISLSTTEEFLAPLSISILAMADSTGLFQQDLVRLLSSSGQIGEGGGYVSDESLGNAELSGSAAS